MEPEAPMSEPTVVKSVFCSMNPSATSAKPELAFKTVMMTAARACQLTPLVAE